MTDDCCAGHCVTCSDEGVADAGGRARPDGLARAWTTPETGSEVMTDLVGALARGDVVLVHAGVALASSRRRAA